MEWQEVRLKLNFYMQKIREGRIAPAVPSHYCLEDAWEEIAMATAEELVNQKIDLEDFLINNANYAYFLNFTPVQLNNLLYYRPYATIIKKADK